MNKNEKTKKQSNRNNSIDIAQIAVESKKYVNSRELHQHAVRGIIIIGVGFIGLICTLWFLIQGPDLQESALLFSAFLVFVFVVLFVGGLITTVGPLGAVFAHQRLQTIQSKSELLEVMEERNELSDFIKKVLSANDSERINLLKENESRMMSLTQ